MRTNNDTSLNTFKIASTYIGTVVGAGFASGQEVLQFFSAFGWNGLWGGVLATILFFFFGYSILLLGKNLNANSHVEIVRFTNGKIIGTVIDIVITIFLFGALAAMFAGAGAIFEEQFHIPALWGTIAMAIITLLTVMAGTKGVINAISYVVPFLLLSVLFISLYSIVTNPITAEEIQVSNAMTGAAPNWWIAALNYTSYNLVIAIAVLAPMGAKAESKGKLFFGALLGAIGLGIGVLAIYFSVLTNIIFVGTVEVPMIEIAQFIGPFIQLIFAVVLFSEVYTTAVGNLYGFVRRIAIIRDLSKRSLIIFTTIIAFAVSQLGFSNMVKYLYPAVGYGGMLLFVGIIYVWVAKRDVFR